MSTSDRGFAHMDPEKRRAICSKGGKAAHLQGNAHEWNSEAARDAARKSAESRKRKRAAKTAETAETV